MGNTGTKLNKTLLDRNDNNLSNHSCRVTKDYSPSIQIYPTKIHSQFGNNYLYFPLPKEFLKSTFNQINILYENQHSNLYHTDSCQIKKTNPIRNIIDNIEYTEYHAISEKKGKFVVRINQQHINKSMVVYNITI